MRFKPKSSGLRGSRLYSFTLVELLVSMAILSVLILILAKILDTTRQAWLNAESGNDSFREGRAALYVMMHDLRNAHVTLTTPMMVNTNYSSLPAMSANNLFFLAATSQTAQLSDDNSTVTGDLCSVGYYIAYTADNTSAEVIQAGAEMKHSSYKLYRYFHTSKQAYDDLRTGILFSGAGPTNLGSGTDEVLAHNVYNLKVAWTTTAIAPTFQTDPTAFTVSPSEISVSLDALNGHFAEQFTQASSWQQTTTSAYKRAAHTFSDRAPIPPSQ